ncbi:contact-dependent growth inhibition system immunity protein [Avibacterium avium]|uniref:contact-dependent growth inhibition system immunity protein n=1 Tax=Avibacterium avium TaxID=751 RepID=UPI003BF85B7A
MKKRNMILIQKNREFIFISSYIKIGPLAFRDPDQDSNYLPIDISSSELGRLARDKLNKSKWIDDVFIFNKILMSEKVQSSQKNSEKELKTRFGYKTKKAIYQYMDFLVITIDSEEISIEPSHQYGLASYTGVQDKDGEIIEFKYPLDINDDELGNAINEAFKYCTSIYK